MQLQQKEFQQTIKEKEKKKRKAFYKNSLAKCNCSKYGLFPSTLGGILLFAEFSEHNLVQKEKKNSAAAFTIFSVLLHMRNHIKERKKILYYYESTQKLAKQMFSAHIRGTDWTLNKTTQPE